MKASKTNYLHHYWVIILFIVAVFIVPNIIEFIIGKKLHESALLFIEVSLIFPTVLAIALFIRYFILSKNFD